MPLSCRPAETLASSELGNIADNMSKEQLLLATTREALLFPSEERRQLSTFERVLTTHSPILESLLLQSPTATIIKLYHTSSYLRTFLQSYPTAWKYLSFRLSFPSGTLSPFRITGSGMLDQTTPRQSRPYALDQLLMTVIIPLSPCLRSLELDNTAVSGQILVSTVLHSRRETLEHLSVRGCKNVSLKYHIIPYLTMFGLQYDVDMVRNIGSSPSTKRLALKSLYTYRCRHHRRRPYLSSSLTRKDSDSEPTHELVNLCHKLGIWTDTAWCATPAGRCYRRRGYVSMRIPQGSPEVWVVFDRLWRSKNWIGPLADQPSRISSGRPNGKLWEHQENGCYGEALGTGEGGDWGEGKMTPAHLRRSHKQFIQNIHCDNCFEEIAERCEQCSIQMHCVGCRKTLCASCAYDRPYPRVQPNLSSGGGGSSSSNGGVAARSFWWAPGATTSPCLMQDPPGEVAEIVPNAPPFNGVPPSQYPRLKFRWCCTEPIFSGGGGISIGTANRDVDLVRAVPLPRGQGWEDTEYSANELSKSFPRHAYGDPRMPDYSLETGHIAMMKWLLGPPNRQVSVCPRNLCKECYDAPQWKVHCKSCSKPLCIEHDLRGLRLRICGYRELALEKITLHTQPEPSLGLQPLNGSRLATNTAFIDSVTGFGRSYVSQHQGSAASSFTEEIRADGLSQTNHPGFQEPLQQHEESPLAGHEGTHTLSASNSIHSRSSSPSSVYFDSLLDTLKWQGCQSFFCPQYRAIGDQRQRCPSDLRECTMCSVNVCQDCIFDNPPCDCSYCGEHYLCPNCAKFRGRDGICRKRQEDEMKRHEKWRVAMDALEDILQRKLADEIAEFAGQFFGRIEPDDVAAAPTSSSSAATAIETNGQVLFASATTMPELQPASEPINELV